MAIQNWLKYQPIKTVMLGMVQVGAYSYWGGTQENAGLGIRAKSSWFGWYNDAQWNHPKSPWFLLTLSNFTWFGTEWYKYFFETEYKYQILFGLKKSPNSKYYSDLRISKYQIQIEVLGQIIQILNTKYRIAYNIRKKQHICYLQNI